MEFYNVIEIGDESDLSETRFDLKDKISFHETTFILHAILTPCNTALIH